MKPAYSDPIPSVEAILVNPETRPLAYCSTSARASVLQVLCTAYFGVGDETDSGRLERSQEDVREEPAQSDMTTGQMSG